MKRSTLVRQVAGLRDSGERIFQNPDGVHRLNVIAALDEIDGAQH
jgi:hypothetical protein